MGINQVKDKHGFTVLSPGTLKVLGEYDNLKSDDKFGFYDSVGNTEITVWDGGALYSYRTEAATLTVSSSSTADDVGSTGATSVQVSGLDGNYDEISETIAMDGQTGATLTKQFLRVHRVIVRAAGSGAINAGDIYVGSGTITNGVPAVVDAKVLAGNGQTLMALRTVPRGSNHLISSLTCSTAGNATNNFGTIRLVVRPFGEVFQTKDKFVLQRGVYQVDHSSSPIKIPAKADYEIRAVTSANTMDVAARWEFDRYIFKRDFS